MASVQSALRPADDLFLRLGPSRRWYLVAVALWVGAFLLLFVYGYGEKNRMDEAAAGFDRADEGGTLKFRVGAEEAGTWVFWLETEPGTERLPLVQAMLDQGRPRPVLVTVNDERGADVPVTMSTAFEHRTATGLGRRDGWAVGEAELAPGVYRVTLSEYDGFSGGGAAVAGLAAAPAPAAVPPWPLAASAGAALLGLVTALVTVRSRKRATERAAAGQ
ncbi:hypothetical protein [Streptomyces aidingensis]|uniref:Uncharacterized protein n=1 Tax=Streptomyces aidingensis TaxID=910347 RepID=A0A1I1VEM2_9ACTN|nr:hypothetical protein [Streptomyces aidingensis]SFD81512.1 hypothetical protein SAMN05421773_1357 [Streptomyces aidingensis]